jgi:hypothetical protein
MKIDIAHDVSLDFTRAGIREIRPSPWLGTEFFSFKSLWLMGDRQDLEWPDDHHRDDERRTARANLSCEHPRRLAGPQRINARDRLREPGRLRCPWRPESTAHG